MKVQSLHRKMVDTGCPTGTPTLKPRNVPIELRPDSMRIAYVTHEALP